MARDLTVRINSQNPDGTFNVSMDPGNPLMTAPATTTALAPIMAPPGMPAQGYRARLGTMEIVFASEADFLKTDRYFRDLIEQQAAPPSIGPVPILGGGGSSTTKWLRTGANVTETVVHFLRDRDLRNKLGELQSALDESREARAQLDDIEKSTPALASLVAVLRRLFLAERDATEASVAVLEDELTAVDIQTGAGVAKVAADLLGDGGGFSLPGGGTGTALAAGGIGLGLGMLLSNNRSNDRTRRRTR